MVEITSEVPPPAIYPRGGTALTGDAAVSTEPPGFQVCWPNPWNFASSQAAISIEQENTGLFYDSATATFKPEAECASPLIYLQVGVGLSQGTLTAVIDTPFAVWTDGYYLIRFYDLRMGATSKVCFNVGELWIYKQVVLPSGQAMTDAELNNLQSQITALTTVINQIKARVDKLPLDWQVANRTLEAKQGAAHNTLGTVGRWLNDVKADIQAIKTKLGI